MKNADNLEVIKELLVQMTQNNNGQIGNNLHTIKELMNEFNETTKNKNMGLDFFSCLKPVANSFLQSQSSTKNNSNSPDLGAYVCKLNNDDNDDYKPCPGPNKQSKYHKHKQCDDSDDELCDMSGVKLTI